MGIIYFITITGSIRTPVETIAFLEDASNSIEIRNLGIDLRDYDIQELRKKYELDFPEFIVGGKLSTGEIGCLLSHQLAYQQIIDRNIEWALIIEDDTKMLINFHQLNQQMLDWAKQDLDIVHLAPNLGGVIKFAKSRKLGKAYVPPLGAYAYWVSKNGASKLLTKNAKIGGVADWPIQIASLHSYATPNDYAHSSINNSLIGENQEADSISRVSLSYRPINQVLRIGNFRKVIEIVKVYGLTILLKYMLAYRFYRRFAKIFSHRQKGDNRSDFLIF